MIRKTPKLKLNYFELGYLFASIKKDAWGNMPRKLWLRLHIMTTSTYLEHKESNKQAQKDIKRWSIELQKLEKKEN